MMGPVQRITESIVHDALPLPKVGAVIGGKKVTSVKVSSTDRDYYTTGITLERGAKRKDIQAGLSELLNCHILNSQVGDLAVRVTHFEMIPTKKGPTIYVVMRIVPMVYNNPGKTELTAKEDFEKHYGPEFTAKNPKKWFREFAVKNPHGPAHRDKLWKFVGWVGESYGYCDKDTMYHRRASTIMPKIKITKAIDGANTFYHTHPSKDEPSLTSPDDYMLYFDLSQEPRNIRHFYTIMKDRIDYFKITPRKENRDAYVRIDQDKFLDEVDAKIDELMDKHSDDFPDDKQGGLNFCEKVTKQTVKWLNKKYGKYVKITYSCFYRVRKNPEETDFTNLHLGDSFIARAIADIRSGEYSWPSTDVNQMPQEKYAYWFGQYYFMDDDPEKQVGLLASQQEFESVGRVRDRTRKIGFLPGRLKGINHYLDLKIHEDYSNYDMMNLMNLHIDIMRLDSDVTDGGGVKTRLEELAKQLELPDEIRDNLIMIEEARILGAHTEEAKTLSGDFYMVLLLVDLCQRAVEVMDEVRAGTKTLEYAKYEIYAKLKEQAIRLLDVEISAYMNAFNQGKKSMRLNPPPRFKKGEFEAFIPPEYLQATGIVTEALEQYAPYQEGKPFLTGRNKVNMRVPSNGTVSTVMIGSLNTGNLQIIVPAKGHPMPDDAPAAALEAYQAVVNRLNEYGLNIPTEEQEVGSLTVSNPRKNNQLIIVAGPSGAGKSTTLRNLDKMLPNSKLIRSYVTRPKRKSDRSGEKNFVTEKQFKEMVAGGEFLEHAKQKSGDYYGKRLEDFKADADYLITEASLSGVNRLKKAFPGAYTVYLEPSESAEMIRKRLLRRGDMSPQMARGRSSKIPSHIKSSKMMPFDKRIITRQGKFDSIALEIMDSIPRSNPASPFRVPKGVVMENPNLYYEAHLHTSRSTNNFFPGDVPVAPPDLLRGNPSNKPVSIRIEESPNKAKKMVAYFYDKEGKKVKTTHFGARGMSDYTQHKDPKRKDNYLSRHGGMGEDWKDPTTAGALSRWILWGKPSLRESFNDYKKKFRLEGVMAVTNTRMNPVKAKFLDGKAQTLVFVKPRGLNAWLQIKRLLPGPVLKKRWVKVDRDLISTHYEEHKGKPHFNRLVDYYDGQWVLALIVGARYDAVRAIIGSSKPEQLKEGEIRKVILDQYGDSSYSLLEDWTSGVDNGIHASDSVEAANRELRLWFDSPIGKPPKFLNLSSHPVEEENDDNFHPFAGLTVPVDNWNMCAELVVDFYEAMPWLPGWIKGKEPPILLVGGVTVLVILNIYVFKALVGKDPVVQGGNPFSEEDPLPEAQRLRLNKLIEDLRRRRPSLVNPKAPGYNSYAWTTQDWRSIKVNNKGEVDYSKKCGAEDTQVADGTPRLCLPAEVVRTLIKSKNGKEILLTQARKKARAAKGQRVPWHPRIKEIWKRVEDKTVKDRPNPPNANLAPGNRVFNEPLLEALEVAKGYMGSMGKTYKTTVPIKRINEPLMRRMAKAYDETPNGYDDSKTIKSYEAFIKETNAQFLAIKAAGYVVEIDDDDPYRSSHDMIDDLRNNKRLKIFSAEAGFGSKPITDEQRKKNVLLRRTKHKDINGKTLLVEEMFRFTHDFFGHALKGNGFGPIGEENAWSSHSMMYSPLARPAMTTETRAQFAWTFYSGANRQTEKTRRLANILRREGKMEEAEKIRKEIQGNFLYPDQKMILLPNEFTENKYPLDNPGEWRHGKMMDDDKDPFASMFN